MYKAIDNLVKSDDVEAICIGEMLSSQVEKFVFLLQERGFTRLESEEGVVEFCCWVRRRANKSYQIFTSYNEEDILDRLVHCCKRHAAFEVAA